MPSEEDLKAEIERLRAENAALKKPARGQMSLKVSEKGGLSVYSPGGMDHNDVAKLRIQIREKDLASPF